MRFGPMDLAFHFHHGIVTEYLLVRERSCCCPGQGEQVQVLGQWLVSARGAPPGHPPLPWRWTLPRSEVHLSPCACTWHTTAVPDCLQDPVSVQRDVLLEGSAVVGLPRLGQPRLNKLTFQLSRV